MKLGIDNTRCGSSCAIFAKDDLNRKWRVIITFWLFLKTIDGKANNVDCLVSTRVAKHSSGGRKRWEKKVVVYWRPDDLPSKIQQTMKGDLL